jgi:hypothetical protein
MAPVIRGVALAAWLFAVCTLTAASPGQAEGTLEDDVKATFLFNFTKYVEWPAAAFQSDDEPFRVCVIGSTAFSSAVDRVIANEAVDSHPLVRAAVETAEAARGCHILFVGRADAARAVRLLSAIHAVPVLTVSDAPEFLRRGATIAFVVEGNRVRFDVNLADAKSRGLTISSKLFASRGLSGTPPS